MKWPLTLFYSIFETLYTIYSIYYILILKILIALLFLCNNSILIISTIIIVIIRVTIYWMQIMFKKTYMNTPFKYLSTYINFCIIINTNTTNNNVTT